jgi:hypothetical protein
MAEDNDAGCGFFSFAQAAVVTAVEQVEERAQSMGWVVVG